METMLNDLQQVIKSFAELSRRLLEENKALKMQVFELQNDLNLQDVILEHGKKIDELNNLSILISEKNDKTNSLILTKSSATLNSCSELIELLRTEIGEKIDEVKESLVSSKQEYSETFTQIASNFNALIEKVDSIYSSLNKDEFEIQDHLDQKETDQDKFEYESNSEAEKTEHSDASYDTEETKKSDEEGSSYVLINTENTDQNATTESNMEPEHNSACSTSKICNERIETNHPKGTWDDCEDDQE